MSVLFDESKANTLGDPLSVPPAKRQAEIHEPRETTVLGVRPGETGLGVPPDFKPPGAKEIGEDELEPTPQEPVESKGPASEDVDRIWKLGRTLPMLSNLLKVGLWISILMGGVLGLFIVNQGTQFVLSVAELSQPWKSLAIIGGVFSVAMITAVIVRLIWLLSTVKASKTLELLPTAALDEREHVRDLSGKVARKQREEARQLLKSYLIEYPLADNGKDSLDALGMSRREVEALKRSHGNLCDEMRPVTTDQWLHDFENDFQKQVDGIADRLIKRWAKKVALGTAASPLSLVDQLIVLYASYAMINDLIRLYNLRPVLGQTAVILVRVVVQTYLSGIMEDVSEQTADGMMNAYEEWIGEAAGILGGAARAVLPKTAEAALNGMLIWRLGKHAIKIMRPIAVK
jgi:uncharacterized membrane protein YcjF (UPF0283 family)